MKRFYMFVMSAFMLTFSGCYDDALVQRVTDLEGRVKTLEDVCKEINVNISSLQTIVTALQENDYVTSVTPVVTGGEEVGYTIAFASSRSVTIYHGRDGMAGEDGTALVIGLKADKYGTWYWTIDGEWLLDDKGNMVRASGTDGLPGQDGKDGVTPKLKIENEWWHVSYDNGVSWSRLSKAKGEDGDSFFSGISETENEMVFTLADGTSFTVLKNKPFGISFDADDIRFSTGCSYAVNYTIHGADEFTSMQVMASDGLAVSFEQKSLENGIAEGIIIVTTPKKIIERASVVVLVSDGRSKVVMEALNFIYEGSENVLQPVFIITSAESLDVAAKGGFIEIPVQTNMNYMVEIDDASVEWLSLALATKTSLREETISLTAVANTGARRYGFVYIVDVADRSLVQTICVAQEAGEGEDVRAVKFNDASFGAYVIQHYDSDLDGVVSYEEAEKIIALDITSKKFTDLKGIEHMVNLETLMCSGNKMSSLDMRSNALLKILDCGNNTSLDTLNLSSCVNLENLVCNNTYVRVLDLSAATKLKYINTSSCSQLEKIEFRDAGLLEKMECYSCKKLKNIDLSTCGNLSVLECNGCNLGALNLSSCRNLTTLDCSHNALASLDLSHCRKLYELDMSGNPLTYVNMGANPYIVSLKLTSIPAVTVVGPFVKSIDCAGGSSGVTSVNFSECPNLESVRIENFKGELDLSNLKKLKEVHVDQGRIKNMIFDGSNAIESLILADYYGTYSKIYLYIENWGKMDLPNLKSFNAVIYLDYPMQELDLSSCPLLSKFTLRIRSSAKLGTLVLHEDVEIEGVTVNRSTDHIPEEVGIEFR